MANPVWRLFSRLFPVFLLPTAEPEADVALVINRQSENSIRKADVSECSSGVEKEFFQEPKKLVEGQVLNFFRGSFSGINVPQRCVKMKYI